MIDVESTVKQLQKLMNERLNELLGKLLPDRILCLHDDISVESEKLDEDLKFTVWQSYHMVHSSAGCFYPGRKTQYMKEVINDART